MAGFSAEIITAAENVQKKYGIPASVTLAQWALESGWGKSTLSTKYNNYFGITANTGVTYDNGYTYAVYANANDSFDAYGKLLSSSLYKPLWSGSKNSSDFIDSIADKYSGNSANYAATIKSIISSYGLEKYNSEFSVDSGYTSADTTATNLTTFQDIENNVASFVIIALTGIAGCYLFVKAFRG